MLLHLIANKNKDALSYAELWMTLAFAKKVIISFMENSNQD